MVSFKMANKRVRTYLSLVSCTVLCAHNVLYLVWYRGPYIWKCTVVRSAIFKLAFGLRVSIVQCSSLSDFPFQWGMALGATISGIIWVDTRYL